jgi:hypothetical protein
MRLRSANLRSHAVAAAIVASLVIASTVATAQELPDDAESYASALNKIATTKGRTSLESLFGLALNACIKLNDIVPNLNDSQLDALGKKLPGLMLKRDRTPLAHPSAKFFADLARRKGRPQDRAFFDLYARTEPDATPGIAAYVRHSSPDSRCTSYDGKLMADLYGAWLAFRTKYHDDYSSEAQGEIDNLDAELLSGICACGGADETAAGLQKFVDELPDVPIAPKIRDRIALIRSGHSDFRFNCKASAAQEPDPPAAD